MAAAIAGRVRFLSPSELLENHACQSLAQAVGCEKSPAPPDTFAAGWVAAANRIAALIGLRQGEPIADGVDLVTTQMEYELKARQRGERLALVDAVDALGKLRGWVAARSARVGIGVLRGVVCSVCGADFPTEEMTSCCGDSFCERCYEVHSSDNHQHVDAVLP